MDSSIRFLAHRTCITNPYGLKIYVSVDVWTLFRLVTSKDVWSRFYILTSFNTIVFLYFLAIMGLF